MAKRRHSTGAVILVAAMAACSVDRAPEDRAGSATPSEGTRASASTPATAPAADSLLVAGVSIVDPEAGSTSAPRDVLIAGGEIVEVAAAIAEERAATVLEADGLYALAGLIDVHVHFGDGGLGALSRADREDAIERFLPYGVTTILNVGGGGGTEEELARWQERCAAGGLRCPDIYGTGVMLTAPGGHPIATLWQFPPDTAAEVIYARGAIGVAEGDDVGPLLDRKVALEVDAVKIVIEDWDPDDPLPRLSPAKIAELARASHERGLRVFAHVSTAEHVRDALAGGVDGVVHSAEDRIPDATLAEMATRGFFYAASLSLYDGFIDRALGVVGHDHEPYAVAGSSERALASLAGFAGTPFTAEQAAVTKAALYDNLRRAAAAGVPLALGTDADNPSVFPGYSAHEELELMVEAGLPPARALVAATTGSARFLGKEATLGKIAPGFEADLLILRENPLDDILATRTLHAVIHDGRVLRDVVAADRPIHP